MTLDKQITHFDLILAARWIINAACQKKCKREKFPNRAAVYDEKIDDEFVQLKPYNYLQMSYYKASRYVTTYQELINTKTHQTDYLKKAIQVRQSDSLNLHNAVSNLVSLFYLPLVMFLAMVSIANLAALCS